jgi:hypothetical protein
MATIIPVPAQIEAVKREIQTRLEAQEESSPGFDIDLWLQDWLRRPQPALGGRKPAELLSTEAGIESVRRALGSILGGSYQ